MIYNEAAILVSVFSLLVLQLAPAVPSDAVARYAFLTIAVTSATGLIAQFLTYRKNAEVKQVIDDTKKVADATHMLVNSATGVADDLLVTTLEELLLAKPGEPSVITRLTAARKARDQHRIGQAIVDDRAKA